MTSVFIAQREVRERRLLTAAVFRLNQMLIESIQMDSIEAFAGLIFLRCRIFDLIPGVTATIHSIHHHARTYGVHLRLNIVGTVWLDEECVASI